MGIRVGGAGLERRRGLGELRGAGLYEKAWRLGGRGRWAGLRPPGGGAYARAHVAGAPPPGRHVGWRVGVKCCTGSGRSGLSSVAGGRSRAPARAGRSGGEPGPRDSGRGRGRGWDARDGKGGAQVSPTSSSPQACIPRSYWTPPGRDAAFQSDPAPPRRSLSAAGTPVSLCWSSAFDTRRVGRLQTPTS